uniref:Serpin n=2 Tax=Braconinae TaxID=65225 RepID=A0A455LAU0_9HYME|nr:serpin [Habrobracon hebetor]
MATPEATVVNFAKEAEACRTFSTNFYKAVSSALKGQNIISSPLSVHVLLSYLTHGAKGRTVEEMVTGLSVSDAERLHIGYKSLIAALNGTTKDTLVLSNSAYLNHDLKIAEMFSAIGADYYDFVLSKLDFSKAEHAAGEINSWVEKKTNGKIKDLMSPNDLNGNIKMVLVNAIYFKGSWKYPFSVDATCQKDFHVSRDVVKKVPMMTLKEHFRHGDLPGVKARFLEMPYSDENLSMVVILPDEIDGLSEVEKNFNWDEFLKAEHSSRETRLELPKFKIECKIDLNQILRSMGFVDMFENTANFSGIADMPLQVSKVVQKAFIEVNEEGTEAAAATQVRMMMRCMPLPPDEFNVDRPFMIVIRHKPSDIPLFAGSVRDIGDAN